MSAIEHGQFLPEATADSQEQLRATLGEQIVFYRSLVHKTEPVPFTATLPVVIGYVPEGERDLFGTFNPTDRPEVVTTFGRDSQAFAELVQGMPGTTDLIHKDMAALETFGVVPSHVVLGRTTTTAGAMERAVMLWHADPPVPFYLISDMNATEHYAGGARFVPSPGMKLGNFPDIEVDNPAFEGIKAKDYAIVRMGPNNVHKKPRFSKTAKRTLMIHLMKTT